jgi:hypothetical protein
MSARIMIGRRRCRSIQTPAGSPIKRKGSHCDAPSTPISEGEASSVSAATNGIARVLTWVPRSEIVWPAHRPLKSRSIGSRDRTGDRGPWFSVLIGLQPVSVRSEPRDAEPHPSWELRPQEMTFSGVELW